MRFEDFSQVEDVIDVGFAEYIFLDGADGGSLAIHELGNFGNAHAFQQIIGDGVFHAAEDDGFFSGVSKPGQEQVIDQVGIDVELVTLELPEAGLQVGGGKSLGQVALDSSVKKGQQRTNGITVAVHDHFTGFVMEAKGVQGQGDLLIGAGMGTKQEQVQRSIASLFFELGPVAGFEHGVGIPFQSLFEPVGEHGPVVEDGNGEGRQERGIARHDEKNK